MADELAHLCIELGVFEPLALGLGRLWPLAPPTMPYAASALADREQRVQGTEGGLASGASPLESQQQRRCSRQSALHARRLQRGSDCQDRPGTQVTHRCIRYRATTSPQSTALPQSSSLPRMPSLSFTSSRSSPLPAWRQDTPFAPSPAPGPRPYLDMSGKRRAGSSDSDGHEQPSGIRVKAPRRANMGSDSLSLDMRVEWRGNRRWKGCLAW